jgi:transposase
MQFRVGTSGQEHPAGDPQAVSAEEKIRIVLDGLRGESSIAELCRREGIAEGLYYSWSREFLEAGVGWQAIRRVQRRGVGASREARDEVVAEQVLELRLLKKKYGPPRPQE